MTALPALAAGDVYLYSHGNGAIYVGYADGRSMLLPLAEAVAVVQGCEAAGSQVVVAWDDTSIARAAVERIRASGVGFTAFDAGTAPHVWSDGTDALIEAASLGTDPLLDDLIERGADVGRRDASGSTALHHAAANGRLHAIEALVAAGSDLDGRNDQGFTPLLLARACRAEAAAQLLVDLGASTTTTATATATTTATAGGAPVRYRRSHAGVFAVWLIPAAFVVAVAIGFWPLPPAGAAALAAFAIGVALVAPPRPFWAGGAPVELEGAVLVLRTPLGRLRRVDLSEVTVAGIGGATRPHAHHGARWLLLGHPDGTPVGRRSLRRLLVPAVDVDALAARLDRVIVVPLAGGHHDEVIASVGNVLTGTGTDLSSSLRAQLVRARRSRFGTR